MHIIEPDVIIIDNINGENILRKLEQIGRVCYKSENQITEESAYGFISKIISSGHESVIEHVSVSVKVVCDRGVSHEIVRHRLASYSQESTRYCNYSKSKFDGQLTFIKPNFLENGSELFELWKASMQNAENTYLAMLSGGATPQMARSVLPNSLKTEIIMTMNLREWRHFFRLRLSSAAHPQMQQVAKIICEKLQREIPIVFDEFML